MTAPLPGIVYPSLVELATDLLVNKIEGQFNANLAVVAQMYRNDGRKVALEKVLSNHIYITEGVKPLGTPAVFIIADRSEHDLEFQNMAKQVHHFLVAVLVEDMQAEAARLKRKVYRYARAMWMTLHDRNLGGPVESQSIHVFVDQITYSPLIGSGEGADRKFRGDATLRCRVHHYENLGWTT